MMASVLPPRGSEALGDLKSGKLCEVQSDMHMCLEVGTLALCRLRRLGQGRRGQGKLGLHL